MGPPRVKRDGGSGGAKPPGNKTPVPGQAGTGDVARRTGISARTIRFYESERVISPATCSATGYRVYDNRVLSELRFVRQAQRLGFSLSEVQELVSMSRGGKKPCPHVAEMCDRHLQEIALRLKELRTFRTQLKATKRMAQGECGMTADGFCMAVMKGTKSRAS